MRKLLRISAPLLLLVVASALTTAPSHAGSHDRSVMVAPKSGGGFAFIVPATGSIKVYISSPTAVKAKLVGPKGDVSAAKGPSTSIDLNYEAKDDDVKAGSGWAVLLTGPDGSKAPFEAKVKVEHQGNGLNEKDLNTALDHGARAAPKVPQGLPPSTPLVPDATSIAKIVAAKIPNSKPNVSAVGSAAILRKATPIHDSIPRPPAPSTKAPPPGPGASNNFGGIPIQVPAGRTFVPIVSIDVSNDDDASRTCSTAACPIKGGDVLTFTLGPNSDKLAHEAHFVFFDPDVDIAMKVIEWKDDVRKVSVQMPKQGSEHFDKLGAIYLGTPNAQVTSTFFGFKYDPTILLFLPMDTSLHPAPAKVYSTVTPSNPEWVYSGPMDNKTRFAVTRGSAIGTSGKDTFFSGVTLKNNWVVKKVEHQGWASSLVLNPNASHSITEVHENSPNATVVVDWFYDPGATLQYTLGLKVSGREGTLPY